MGGQRESNLELYRIVTMLAIVAHHFVVNSGILNKAYEAPLSANSVFLFLFGAWGKTGINCFMLITGYFMCKSSITLKKYLKLIFEMLFYNVVIVAVFIAAGQGTIKDAVNSVLIIRTIDSNHFFACFLVFYLLIPFLNILLYHINKEQHERLIAILAFLYIVLGTIPKFSVAMNYISWFNTLYVVAAYIRFYPLQKRRWGIMTVLFIVMAVISILVCLKLNELLIKQDAYRFVSDSNTFFAFAISICSFMYFKELKIRRSKLINAIGKSTFGVLCIHANSMMMINWLWKDFLNVQMKYEWPFIKLVIFLIVTVIGIFAVCTVIDIVRSKMIEKRFLKYIEKTGAFLRLKKEFEIF